MTEGLIITKEGRVIALDDNGGIKEPIKSKDLEETMANENTIEFLEKEISNNEQKIEKLTQGVSDSREIIECIKKFQAVITVAGIIGGLIVAKYSECSLIVAGSIPTAMYAIPEVIKTIFKKDIKESTKRIGALIVLNSFVREDLVKEQSKQKKKVMYKNPSFTVKKIDDSKIREYQERYDNLLNVSETNENKNLSVAKLPVLSRPYYRKVGNINE